MPVSDRFVSIVFPNGRGINRTRFCFLFTKNILHYVFCGRYHILDLLMRVSYEISNFFLIEAVYWPLQYLSWGAEIIKDERADIWMGRKVLS